MGMRGLIVALILLAAAWIVPLTISGAFSDPIPPIEIGALAPEFGAQDLTTRRAVTLENYRGHVVLLNLWATWCAPCLREMPAMERIHRKLGDEGLKVVAVSLDASNDGSIVAFANQLGLTFDILYDPTHTIERTYQVTALPQSFVIDRNGFIVSREFGAIPWDDEAHEAMFRELLEAPARSDN